jgi:hypothetical protein
LRRQRTVPFVGPSAVDAPECRASCRAEGHGAQDAVPGGAFGSSTVDVETGTTSGVAGTEAQDATAHITSDADARVQKRETVMVVSNL